MHAKWQRATLGLGLCVVAAGCWAASAAEQVASGLPVGGKIGTYSSTKCAGADDGVEAGKSLCYT